MSTQNPITVTALEHDLRDKAKAVFVSAVEACIDRGPEGESLLRVAYHDVRWERQRTIIDALSFFRSDAVADFLRIVASDEEEEVMWRCAAVWALGRLRRQEDQFFLVGLLYDAKRNVRQQALAICAHYNVPVRPAISLALLSKFARRKSVGDFVLPPSTFTEIVALFAYSESEDVALLGRFSKLLTNLWPRIAETERQWMLTFWPEATPPTSNPQPLTAIQRAQLERWWADQHLSQAPKRVWA